MFLTVYFAVRFIYLVTAATAVCCILMQILCVVSQKSLNLVPQTRPPTGAPPLDLAGGTSVPRPPVFFYVPLQ